MGTGSAILVSGDRRTVVISIRNIYKNHSSYGLGVYGTYNANITDSDSEFYGNNL